MQVLMIDRTQKDILQCQSTFLTVSIGDKKDNPLVSDVWMKRILLVQNASQYRPQTGLTHLRELFLRYTVTKGLKTKCLVLFRH